MMPGYGTSPLPNNVGGDAEHRALRPIHNGLFGVNRATKGFFFVSCFDFGGFRDAAKVKGER
jgi:hypothetical protein